MVTKGESRLRAIDERLGKVPVVLAEVNSAIPTMDALWMLAKADGFTTAANLAEFVEEGNVAIAETSEWAKRHRFTSVHPVGSVDYTVDLLAAREGFDRAEVASEMARVLYEARALDDPTIASQSRFRT